jgi:hypothetical protein
MIKTTRWRKKKRRKKRKKGHYRRHLPGLKWP